MKGKCEKWENKLMIKERGMDGTEKDWKRNKRRNETKLAAGKEKEKEKVKERAKSVDAWNGKEELR